MKPLPLFLCSLSILNFLRAEPPKSSGEDDAVSAPSLAAITQAAVADNPSIKEARAKWEAMKQRVPQAAAWDDPKVSANTRVGRFVDISRNGFTDQMLSVEQMIPISGKNRSRERIAAAEALGALEDVRRKELDVIVRVRAAWFHLVRDYALLELNRSDESLLSQTVEVARARLAVGQQGQADVLTAQNEMNRLEEARHDLLRTLSEDTTQLQVLMNRDPFAPLSRPATEAAPAYAHFSDGELRAALLRNRPELRSAEAGITAAKARLELARRDWIPDPTLSLEAQRYNGASQVVSELDAAVSFSVPWLNGRKYRAEESEARKGVEAAQQKLESSRAEALGMLRDQLQKIETLHHHIELFRDRLIPTAHETVQTNRTNYENGRIGFLELVLSERNLRELEGMLQQHVSDYHVAVAELEAVVGVDPGPLSSHHEAGKGGAK
ncbi:outer membrane efflux protein [Chthoniobacter flavus Ellin428]|uniref:Outer membrane efflux protein n=1 Tax=Chthoniobacter flavus Ellin428 TaxID=497964 RepID=B4D1B6_9BACT|nr:TolC family protein [Chthoniobacter flavus]EDY19528.1 outer membrane efflux protein [Chthoniobacter flavus Ellin428]TCO92773.1 outer membrane protein TolC [Chthoniobacter flavus]